MSDLNARRRPEVDRADVDTHCEGVSYAPFSHEGGCGWAPPLPPHDADLERDVAAIAALEGDTPTSNGTVAETMIATGLEPDHFYVPLCGRVWSVVLELRSEGQPIDLHTVAARLGCSRDVASLIHGTTNHAYLRVPAWCGLVIEYARCRRMLLPAEAMVAGLLSGQLSTARRCLADVVEEAAA